MTEKPIDQSPTGEEPAAPVAEPLAQVVYDAEAPAQDAPKTTEEFIEQAIVTDPAAEESKVTVDNTELAQVAEQAREAFGSAGQGSGGGGGGAW